MSDEMVQQGDFGEPGIGVKPLVLSCGKSL